MGRWLDHKFFKEMTEKQNKIYEKQLSTRGQAHPRRNRKPVLVVGLVPYDPRNSGNIVPAFQSRNRRPSIPMPHCPGCQMEKNKDHDSQYQGKVYDRCPKCLLERNGNRDLQSHGEICDCCRKTVTYQTIRVCDCGCHPARLGQPMPARLGQPMPARLGQPMPARFGQSMPTLILSKMADGDQDFSKRNVKAVKVRANPESFYFITHPLEQ